MSEFLDDLMRSSQFLYQNLKGLSAQQSIDHANQIVQQIRTSTANEQEKRNQLQQLSQALVVDLSRFGTPADTVQAVSQAISPQRFFQTPEQVAINPEYATPAQQTAAQTLIKNEQDFKKSLVGIKAQADMQSQKEKMDLQIKDRVQKAQMRFNTLNQKTFNALDSANTLVNLIQTGSPVTDNAISTFAAKASGEVGNLSKEDRRPFQGSMSLWSRVNRMASIAATGELTSSDRQNLLTLAQAFKTGAQKAIQKKAAFEAQRTAQLYGLDPNEVMKDLLPPGVLFEDQTSGYLPSVSPSPTSTDSSTPPPASPNIMQFLKPRQ